MFNFESSCGISWFFSFISSRETAVVVIFFDPGEEKNPYIDESLKYQTTVEAKDL